MRYQGPFPGDQPPACTGILLTNLGTPDSTSVADVRRYLKQFLGDPRVVEMPRLPWWLILNLAILRIRPSRSARSYERIWTAEGSPLLRFSRRQADALQGELERSGGGPWRVELAMRYGNPSIADGLERLRRANARRILVLPLYPQYSATTTASTFDEVSRVLRGWRWLPELLFVTHYHRHPAYIRALADSVRESWQQQGEPDRLLISFHGIPKAYAEAGDPYPEQCRQTAADLARELGLPPERWACSFQSRMGRQEWLRPYTDGTLRAWPDQGVKRVQVICPGFPADCLETLEEIGEENRELFLRAGGESFHYIPALNDRPGHIRLLRELVTARLQPGGDGGSR
ncbi:MAG TPA: ferrochelatase [Sedimenticola thiotaurini]|uniref:Ferrochelatase n=1 Tax=Sedimenticola thiotaurini TaxID=1543721 RepID=A0A831RR42_9GAMM|nr:ferrochelatase [Sedimenticola thiotaurini]